MFEADTDQTLLVVWANKQGVNSSPLLNALYFSAYSLIPFIVAQSTARMAAILTENSTNIKCQVRIQETKTESSN